MGRTLIGLIQAAGGAGSGGQTFDNNVPGSDPYTQMTNYIRDGWDNWSQNVTSVASGGSVTCYFNFTGSGSLLRYSHIMRPVQVSMVEQADPGTLAVAVLSQNLDATGLQSSFVVQVTGRGVNGTYSGGSGTPSVNENYWENMAGTITSPGEEPGEGSDARWRIAVAFVAGSYVPPTLGSDVIEFDVLQPADAGNFNPQLTTRRSVTVAQYDNGPPPGYVAEGQFFTNYNDPAGSLVQNGDYQYYNLAQNVTSGTSPHYMTFDAGPVGGLQFGRVYYRYRPDQFSSWSTPVMIEWWDTRLYNSYPGA